MRSRLCIVGTIAFLLGIHAVVAGQPPPASPNPRGPWAVWKVGNAGGEMVGTFASEQEASKERDRRNEANGEPGRFSYLARREKLEADSNRAPPSLKARRGDGTIGASAVKIEFSPREFAITGDLAGQGKWSQHGKGTVTLETALSIFRGLIDGDRVYGIRVVKDGSEPLTTWSFSLEPAKVASGSADLRKGPGGHDDEDVQQIAGDDLKAFSSEKGKAVIGLLADGKGDGSIVTAVPGSNDRVWDANTLGGFKDLADGKKVADETVLDRMGAFLREQDSAKDESLKATADNLRAKLLDLGEDPKETDVKVARQVRQEIKSYLDSAAPEERQSLFDLYAERGMPIAQLWRPSDLKKVQWYQVPATQDVREAVRTYQPPAPTLATSPAPNPAKTTPDNPPPAVKPARLDADFVGKFVRPQRLVFDETQPKPSTPATTTPANAPAPLPRPTDPSAIGSSKKISMPQLNFVDIGSSLNKQAGQTQKTLVPPVTRPPEPTRTPIFQPAPRERPVVTKPGGVIITASAAIDGLEPRDVASASFDPSTGILKFALRSGDNVTCKLDADDFTVAVRSIFDRRVDPSLSMSYERSKPGYLAVDYSGPLFKTRFGKVLYQTDEALGAIIFNRQGDHRAAAAAVIPHYEDLVCESDRTMTTGSRVFLRASGARFVVRKGQLACRDIQTKIDVEGVGYSADYFQEPLHRLARAMSERFNELTDQFDEFKDFRRLVECVALAKWLKRHAIPFDWTALKTRKVAEIDVPALVPRASWRSLFNGRNLDGWRFNGTTEQVEWSLENGALNLAPAGGNEVELLAENYWKNYDVRFTVVTEGPVQFILRKGAQQEGAAVTLDTKGRPQKVELFLANGAWTAVAPHFGRQGTLTIPEPKTDEAMQPNLLGIRIPAGSRISLYAVALRGR
jgi:hypothetical protein